MDPEIVVQIVHSESQSEADYYSTMIVLTNRGRLFEGAWNDKTKKVDWQLVNLPELND